MPIKINLLAEAQAAEELRRQDPVKRAIFGAVAVVVLVLAWGGYTVWQGMQKAQEVKQYNDRWTKMKPRHDLIKTNDAVMLAAQNSINQLNAYATNRFFWGPALHALTQVATNSFATNIQVNRITADQMFMETKLVKAVTNAAGKVVTPARPAGMAERSKMLIFGRDSGSDLDENYNKMKKAIMDDFYFKTVLEAGGGGAKLLDVTRASADPLQPNAPAVQNFVLQCTFEEKLR